MLTFHKTVGNALTRIDSAEPGSWINLIAPTDEELRAVASVTGVDNDFLRAALDDEETSRVEVEEDETLLIIDVPYAEEEENGGRLFTTLPMGIIVAREHIITVCLKENSIVREFAAGEVRNVQTALKTRFILHMLLKVANRYLFYLRQIEKISSSIEHQLYKSQKNKELIQLLTLEKSLVYFSTSLKSTDVTLEKLLRGRIIKLYEDDQDLLEDVLIEIKQAIEMAGIYSSILSGTMDAFASVISNNLNILMKTLTLITILMTIPNIIFSFYGMNVTDLPIPTVWMPIALAIAVTLGSWLLLKKKKLY